MHGFRCTWRILESPLVQRYGYFGADGKELKDDTLTCDVCTGVWVGIAGLNGGGTQWCSLSAAVDQPCMGNAMPGPGSVLHPPTKPIARF